MKPIGISPSRRNFLRKTIVIAPAAAAAAGGAAATLSAVAAPAPGEAYQPVWFSDGEWAMVTHLVDGLIPDDEQAPGAVRAGVPEFIDRQMDTPYGHGGIWYMHGPFYPQAPAHFGYQLPYAPRDLYRKGLAGLQAAVQKQSGKALQDLDAASRDAVLHQLESGNLDIGEVPAKTFFAQLLQNTHEGYFCDPKYGGNKGMAGWRLINFPGARADFTDWVEQYGKPYPLPPVSVG